MTASRSDGFTGGVLTALIAALITALIIAIIVGVPVASPAAAQGFLQRPEAADAGSPVRLEPSAEEDMPGDRPTDGAQEKNAGEDGTDTSWSRDSDASQTSPYTGGRNQLSTIERLIPALEVANASPAMHGLLRHLLLMDTATSDGKAPNIDLVALRLERLLAMGEVDAVFEALKDSPLVETHEIVARRFIEALFYADDSASACTGVRKQIHRYRSAFWRQSFVFCQALAGETGQAMLGIEVLYEEGTVDDAAFFTLIDAVMGNTGARITGLSDPTPLHIAMLRAARQPLPEDAVGSARPAVLRALAISPNTDRETRLFAAEQMVAVGALPAQILIGLYESFDFMPEQLAALGDETGLTPSPEGRAMLYQAVKARTDTIDRARFLQKALQFAHRRGGYWILIKALQAVLLDIQPSTGLTWFAVDAARALYAGGHMQEANAWYDLLRAQAVDDIAAVTAEIEIWPLARIAGISAMEPPPPSKMIAWREQWLATASSEPKHTAERAALFYGLLAGLGEAVTTNDWQALIHHGELAQEDMVTMVMPSTMLWHALATAAREKRVEETILFVLMNLGAAGPAAASPITMNLAVTSLRLVGLEDEARALAIEAAIDNGL
jgi:hypothetical protein